MSRRFWNNRAVVLIVFCCAAADLFGQTTNLSLLAVPDRVHLCEWNLATNAEPSDKSEGSR